MSTKRMKKSQNNSMFNAHIELSKESENNESEQAVVSATCASAS